MVKRTKKTKTISKKRDKLVIQFIPYSQIQPLSSYKRVKMLLDIVASGKIVFMQGRLRPEEEADLIEETMKTVGKSKHFKGIELAVFSPSQANLKGLTLLRKKIADALAGNRDVITVIGPAHIVREIKKDPTKLELMLE